MLKLRPPRIRCVWVSVSPGTARRPPRSMTFVSGPRKCIRACSSEPTVRIRSPFTAIAVAAGLAGSRVVSFPPWRMWSAGSSNVMADRSLPWAERPGDGSLLRRQGRIAGDQILIGRQVAAQEASEPLHVVAPVPGQLAGHREPVDHDGPGLGHP